MEDDFKKDELIEIKLPRTEYDILKQMIEREQALNWFKKAIRNNIVWVVGGGLVTLLILYDKLNVFFHGAIK